MLHPTAIPRTLTLTLRAGERRVLFAPAGSRWTLLRGEARMTEPPRWLGERLVAADIELRDSPLHRIGCAGWIVLQAGADCALRCETPVPLAVRLVAAWRIMRADTVAFAPA